MMRKLCPVLPRRTLRWRAYTLPLGPQNGQIVQLRAPSNVMRRGLSETSNAWWRRLYLENKDHRRRGRAAVDQGQVDGYRVDIRYKSGKEESIQARHFDIDLEAVENPSTLQKFAYTNQVGEETYIYLTPEEVAAITLHPTAFYQ